MFVSAWYELHFPHVIEKFCGSVCSDRAVEFVQTNNVYFVIFVLVGHVIVVFIWRRLDDEPSAITIWENGAYIFI